MAKVRYVQTNGDGVYLQIRHLWGLFYTTSHYLESDKRKAEAKMLKAIDNIRSSYAVYDRAVAESKFAEKAIKNSKSELKHTSSVFDKHIKFKDWISSFGMVSLFPKQSDTWISVINFLRKHGDGLRISAANMKLSVVKAGTEQLRVPTAGEVKHHYCGGGKKQKQKNSGGGH